MLQYLKDDDASTVENQITMQSRRCRVHLHLMHSGSPGGDCRPHSWHTNGHDGGIGLTGNTGIYH